MASLLHPIKISNLLYCVIKMKPIIFAGLEMKWEEEKRDLPPNSNMVRLLRCDTETHSRQRDTALKVLSCMPSHRSHHELLARSGNSTQDLINISAV